MYGKCWSLDDALKAFQLSGNKNLITWSVIITGYSQSGKSLKALMLLLDMHFAEIIPSEFTLVGVLNACSDYIPAAEEGKQVHGYLMRIKGNIPNELTMATILKASSSLAALEQGKKVHACTIKLVFGFKVPMGSALSTMYAKCGRLEDGRLGAKSQTFRRDATGSNCWRVVKPAVYWVNLTVGKGHGQTTCRQLCSSTLSNCRCVDKAVNYNSVSGIMPKAQCVLIAKTSVAQMLRFFMLEEVEKQVLTVTEADYVTFVNILSACSHMGLVGRGRAYFNMMSDKFRMVPRVKHYACMVDMLDRAGKLDEAKEFIESATLEHCIPKRNSWSLDPKNHLRMTYYRASVSPWARQNVESLEADIAGSN
ncbi:hypothetical protein F3Y22_tig00117056pilonHSYRG00791 [Hibiscus syriacus]|uniref:Pentatricopeptide repeat-containing protein n=1 Tax=Hibiscus syriacus TaxID=106335 RepID=A0A6A2W9K5_HIBSY|nr:hypothetical protein F3Y22_tig00117056pilonHSYRG00791 [Hibiscus syriacus]